jgi:hypothetical protein
MLPHETESSRDYEQHQDGGILFRFRRETIEIAVKVRKVAIDQLFPAVTNPKDKAQLFEPYRAVIEEIAFEKYRATLFNAVEISADDILLAGRLLNGMCVV